MDKSPIIEHIKLMLQQLDIYAIRAVYMVVKELYLHRHDTSDYVNINAERDRIQQNYV
ncbi:MAG: hypothetical protein ACI3W5_07545 [Faecousia sp.]